MESLKYDVFNRAIEFYNTKLFFLNELFDTIYNYTKEDLDIINKKYQQLNDYSPEGDINAIQEIEESLPALSVDGRNKYKSHLSKKIEEVNSLVSLFESYIKDQIKKSSVDRDYIEALKEVLKKPQIVIPDKKSGEQYILEIDPSEYARPINETDRLHINTARDPDIITTDSVFNKPAVLKDLEQAKTIFLIEAESFLTLWTNFYSRVTKILSESDSEREVEIPDTLFSLSSLNAKLLYLKHSGIYDDLRKIHTSDRKAAISISHITNEKLKYITGLLPNLKNGFNPSIVKNTPYTEDAIRETIQSLGEAGLNTKELEEILLKIERNKEN